MSTKYKATTINEAYFITAKAWVDVLLRLEQKELIAKSLDHCQKAKGLEIYAYVIMSSHIHVFCKAVGEQSLCDMIRDFKTFTSKMMLKSIIDKPESRREWMLELFRKACSHLKRNPMILYLCSPYGALMKYDPSQRYGRFQRDEGMLGIRWSPSYNIPIYTWLPSDPNLNGNGRYNRVPPGFPSCESYQYSNY